MANILHYFSGDASLPRPSRREAKRQKREVISGFSIEIKNDQPSSFPPQKNQYATILRGMYNIDKRSCSEAFLATIRKGLTVEPKGQTMVNVPRQYPLFKETTTYLQIPRFYGLKHMGLPSIDQTTEGEPMSVDVCLQCEPRDYQRGYLKSLQKIFARGGGLGSGALLCLACGMGKTYSAIYTAIKLGKKCAVLCHNSDLLNQWCDRIRAFTNAKVGIVRSDRVEVSGCDFTIFMMQSIITGRYDSQKKEVFEPFGMVCVDECHHIAAETLHRSLARFPARCVLGLSATPNRKDGLGHTLHYFLGETVAVGKRVNSGTCMVQIENVTQGRAKNIQMRNGKPLISKIITMISEDEERNVKIAKRAKTLFEEKRCILITCHRTKHLTTLKECLITEGVEEEMIGIFKGETSKKRVRQREEEKKRPILIATYSIASEGFDKPELDTLIMASPKSNIEQVIGRILRSKEGKKKSLVIDYCDTYCGGCFIGMARARRKFYRENEYTVSDS